MTDDEQLRWRTEVDQILADIRLKNLQAMTEPWKVDQTLADIRLNDRQTMTEPWKLVVATAAVTAAIAVACAKLL